MFVFYFSVFDELLQDASSEGDAEDDVDSLVNETADVDAFTIKAKIVEALDAMEADGANPRRTAAQIVMDSAAYKKLPEDRQFKVVEALTQHIQSNRMRTKPKEKPLQCLMAFLSVMEVRTLSVVPGKEYSFSFFVQFCTMIIYFSLIFLGL